MSDVIRRLDEARQAIGVGADRSVFQDMPRAYRFEAMLLRALMVAFFWHEEKFEKYALAYLDQIRFAFLDERNEIIDARKK